jgi:hypothetical protein
MINRNIDKLKKYIAWRVLNKKDDETYDSSFMGELFGLETAVRIIEGDLEILDDGSTDTNKIINQLEAQYDDKTLDELYNRIAGGKK